MLSPLHEDDAHAVRRVTVPRTAIALRSCARTLGVGYSEGAGPGSARGHLAVDPRQTGADALDNVYTAIVQQRGDWRIGWVAEVPGVNCQERSREELLKSLKVTLREALEFNREDAVASAGGDFQEHVIAV